jgi:Glycosyl transferase 4-like domain
VRILLLTHYFPPETGAPQARLSALARAWAADGDAVTVLTGMPDHPTGVVRPEYRNAIWRKETRDGYRVLRTWLYATPNEGVARKTLGHLSFMVSSVLLGALPSGRTDVVVVSSPTFFSIGAAWVRQGSGAGHGPHGGLLEEAEVLRGRGELRSDLTGRRGLSVLAHVGAVRQASA